jgi:uncharacterized membrane protein
MESGSSKGNGGVHYGKTGKSAVDILNVRREAMSERTRLLSFIDWIGSVLNQPIFFMSLLFVHAAWILLNLPVYPWFDPWDPYPFTFLATIASAEAPFISLLILMHQQRNTRIDELRAEVQLQVSLHVERQTAMSLRLLREVLGGLQTKSGQNHELLGRMEEFLNPRELMQHIREQMEASEGTDPARTT